jgi:zinc protease
LSQDFDRGVELLADEELHPAFPAAGFGAVRQRELGTAQGEVTAPEHLAAVALNKALYPPADPAQRFASPESVSSLSLDDVKAYYTAVYRPDLTTIVVVGDVDPAHAKDIFEKNFGAWKATGPAPAVNPPAVPDNKALDTLVPDKQRIQSQVQLAQVMAMRRSDPDYPALAVANQSFGAGGSSILFHDVRDVHGLVYGVNSRAHVEKNRSTFTVQFSSDPGKINEAQSLILADLKNLAGNGLDPDELARGKASLVSELPMRVASFGGIAGQLINYAQLGLSLDQATIDARSEIAVTNDKIKAVVTKWIRPSDFVRVILGPGPT